MSRWVALVNPAAGRKPVPVDLVRRVLASAGVDAEVEAIGDAGSMREAALAHGRDRDLIVVGGDGTVSLVVDALMTAAPPRMPTIGILPGGTGCDLLRMFGVTGGIAEAAGRLVGDRTYRIDVGRLDGAWGRRHFVNVAQTGAGAAAASGAVRLSRRLGPARYPLAFAARLPSFPITDVVIEGGRGYRGRAIAVILANGQFFAGGWNVAPKAMLVDGELDVQVFDARKRQAPALVPRIIKGTHLTAPEVRRMSLPSLTVSTAVPWPVEVDGDHIGTTPFDARVLQGAVELKI